MRSGEVPLDGLAGILLNGLIGRQVWVTDGLSIVGGFSTSAYLGRQERLARCQGSSTTVCPLAAVLRPRVSVASLQVSGHADRNRRTRWVHPCVLLKSFIASFVSVRFFQGPPVMWYWRATEGLDDVLHFRGRRDFALPRRLQSVFRVCFEVDYLGHGQQVDSCWRQRVSSTTCCSTSSGSPLPTFASARARWMRNERVEARQVGQFA